MGLRRNNPPANLQYISNIKKESHLKTVYFRDPTKENIKAAARIIRDGGLLAIPTETVYGLGAPRSSGHLHGQGRLRDLRRRIRRKGSRQSWDITETHHEQAWACCGLVTVAKAAHTFGDWVVTKRPTSREEGEKARTCSVCGYTETKVLPKTGGGPTYYTLVFESTGAARSPT